MQCNNEKTELFQDYISGNDFPWSHNQTLYSFYSDRSQGIQFGYEAEFQPHELKSIFEFYSPLETWIDSETWQALTLEQKVSGTREILNQLEHGNLSPLFRRNDAAPAELPEFLYRDDSKNIEVRFGPVDSLYEFQTKSQLIENLLGVGSLQAMISLPYRDFFAHENSWQEHLGWLGFFNELDILERLFRGYLRAQHQPKAQVMKPFTHPFLGPMMEVRHQLLRKYLRENSKGQLLDEESLVRPRRREQSFKFVGSTAYRPDIAAPERLCFEIRDAHKDPQILKQRMARVLFYWQHDLAAFRRFAEIPCFDSRAAFSVFSAEAQKWLALTVPFRGAAHILNFEKPRFCYETYRNFSYPLRDWTPWLKALGASAEAASKLSLAQDNYISKVQTLLELTGDEAKIQLQLALVLFSVESGLFELFRNNESELARGVR
jgi:hypothetical protein